MSKRRKVTIGEKHHGLTYLGEAPKDRTKHRMANVVCDCGRETVVRLSDFGKHKTCGTCPRDNITEHRFYVTWGSMKARCYNKKHSDYGNYGARGVTVQESWINDPRKFCQYLDTLAHAGEPGYTLDRIDNDKGYEEENLRFATRSEQNLNQRVRKDNTSGVKGVSWCNQTGKWTAQYKRKNLGYFTEKSDAIQVRLKTEKEN